MKKKVAKQKDFHGNNLKNLRKGLKMLCNNQAKDIASDVSELERQVRMIQNKTLDQSSASADKLELKLFENYIMDRVDASLKEITKVVNISKSVDTDSKINFLIEPSTSNAINTISNIQPNNQPLRVRNMKGQGSTKRNDESIESEIRTCKPSHKQMNSVNKKSYSKDRFSHLRDLENSSDLKEDTFTRSNEYSNSLSRSSNPPMLTEKPPVWNLKESATKKHPRSDVDIMKCFKQKYPKNKSKKLRRSSSKRKQQRSRSSKRSRRNSIANSSKTSHSSKSRESEINKSIQMVKDLTGKCIKSILNTSKQENKFKMYKSKKSKVNQTKSNPKIVKKNLKCDDKLKKLERMYKELQSF